MRPSGQTHNNRGGVGTLQMPLAHMGRRNEQPEHQPPPYSAYTIPTHETNYGGRPVRMENYPEVSHPQYHQRDHNYGMNHTVAAVQSVNFAIHQNGRNPVNVVCPNCHRPTVTETTTVDNPAVTKNQSSGMFYCVFGGICLVFTGFILGSYFLVGSFIPLTILPVVLIIFGIGFCAACSSQKQTAKLCVDIEHRCGYCKVLLGVSSGLEIFQRIQEQRSRVRFRMRMV